jgi:hypothetical protein
MRYFTELANTYNRHADRIVARHTKDGVFDANFQPFVDFNRDAAAAVSSLNEGLEGTNEGMEWNLESDRVGGAFKKGKVSSADKAATPQELLAKANA